MAEIIPRPRRRQWIPASEILEELTRLGPDTTGLREELRETLSQTAGSRPPP
ncbi:hypothetical protein ACIA8C_42685 [Nocardia sp. NPDC051321]|uniref:hypothetical protein n=1 Tax=Nocardia sp. NPDC051321 TaxID=3364323 RepID=UPI00379DC6DC